MKMRLPFSLLVLCFFASSGLVLADKNNRHSADGSSRFLKGQPFAYQGTHFSSKDELDGLNKIVEILIQRIDDLEDRIIDLEADAPPPTGTHSFSGDFIQGVKPSPSTVAHWNAFISDATGDFSSIEIRSSLGGSALCSDPDSAKLIASKLNTYDPTTGGLVTEPCAGWNWNVGSSINGIELNAGLNERVGFCDENAVVRPSVDSTNWGGVGSDFGGPAGGTCETAPSQTLEVILTR